MIEIELSKIDFEKYADGTAMNPRGEVTDTTDLQASFRQAGGETAGQRDPIIGFWRNDRFVVEDGHRRVTAARVLGWKKIKAEPETAPENEMDLLMRMLVAQVRQNPKASSLALSYRKLIVDHRTSIERVAALVGSSVEKVQLHIDLLLAPASVIKRVDSGDMSWSAFKALRDAPKSVQEEAAKLEKPTVKNVRQTVRQKKAEGKAQAQNVLSAALSSAAQETPLATQFTTLIRQIRASWGSLSEFEQIKITSAAEDLLDLARQEDEMAAAA